MSRAQRREGALWIGGDQVATFNPRSLAWRLLFAINSRSATSRGDLYEAVWGLPYRPPSSDNALYVAIHRLRGQIPQDKASLEVTEDGGYVLVSEEPTRLVGPDDAPRLAVVPAPQLPQVGVETVGRQAELRALREALAAAPLVTLTGVGGVGKTHLASLIVTEAAKVWPGGASFADLCGAGDAEEAGGLVLRALGVTTPAVGAEDGVAIGRHLAGRGRSLLVLDNVEHVLDAVRALSARAREAAPQVRILVTSRERLGMGHEQVVPLSPLRVDEAVALFIDRAGRVRPGYDPGGAERSIIEELVEGLDRLPLSICLAASRLDALAPRTLLARLDARFRVLQRGHSGVGRHPSVLETLRWSWDLLDDHQRRALSRVSVFVGGFGLDDAEAILDDHRSDSPWAMDLLEDLRRKSLLTSQAITGGELRYGMLETVRAFAALMLQDDDERPWVLRRHAERIVAEAQRRDQALYGPDALRALEWLGANLGNLLAVIERFREAAPSLAAQAARLTLNLLHIRGPFGLALKISGQAVSLSSDAPAEVAVGILTLRATLLGYVGGEGAEALLDQAEEAAKGDEALLADIQYCRGQGLMASPATWPEATLAFKEALTLAGASGARWRHALCLERLGVLAHWRGDGPRAVRLLEQAEGQLRALGSHLSLASTWNNLGAAERVLRRPTAVARFEAARAQATAMGATRLGAQISCNLANARLEGGRPDLAIPLYRAAREALGQTGDLVMAAMIDGNLAEALALAHRPHEARSHLTRCLGDPALDAHRHLRAPWLALLAQIYVDSGDSDGARETMAEALALASCCASRACRAEATARCTWVLLALGDAEEAAPLAAAAVALYREVGDGRWLGIAKILQGVAAFLRGDQDHGRAQIEEGLGHLKEAGETLIAARAGLWRRAMTGQEAAQESKEQHLTQTPYADPVLETMLGLVEGHTAQPASLPKLAGPSLGSDALIISRLLATSP